MGCLKQQLKEFPNWQRTKDGHIRYRHWVFRDFCYAFSFINTVAELVEKEQHHPIFILCDIAMCKLICTRAVDGLSENDCILAAKIDASVPNE